MDFLTLRCKKIAALEALVENAHWFYGDATISGAANVRSLMRQVLDSNGSGGLTSQEFCAAMKKLVRRLDAGREIE
jgi:hypothetical protein